MAGGYARDVFFGVVPKDIDIWCSQRNYPAGERRENLVRRLGATFGQTLRLVTPGVQYDNGNEVWEMETTDGRFEPLNIIFVPYPAEGAIYEFDFDICMFMLNRETGEPLDLRHPRSRVDNTITIAPMQDIGRQLEHGLRIKAKYPEFKFVMTLGSMFRNLPLYMAFKNGGLFEERTNVPTQGEITLGDEVGQPTGAGAEQQAGGAADIDNLVREQQAMRDAQERLRAWAATYTNNPFAGNYGDLIRG